MKINYDDFFILRNNFNTAFAIKKFYFSSFKSTAENRP